MTPINWVGPAFEAVLIPVGAMQHSNWYGVACFILAVAIVVAYFGIYVLFVLKDPDRLQSEEYNLQQKELLVSSGKIIVNSVPHTTQHKLHNPTI